MSNHHEGIPDGSIQAHQTSPAEIVEESAVLILASTAISMNLHDSLSISMACSVVMQHGNDLICSLSSGSCL